MFVAIAGATGVSLLTNPLMGAPDEPEHTVKAVAVAHGDLTSHYERVEQPGIFGSSLPRTELEVPSGYRKLRPMWVCWVPSLRVPASCAPPLVKRPGTARVATAAGSYPPLYYGVTGLPSRVLGPRRAVYAMRLLSGAVFAALLATATMAARRATRRPVILAGVALAITPTVVFLGGAINPNGVEIAAAIALWCGLLELLSDTQRRPDRRMALRLAVPAVILLAMRPLSPALLVAIVGVVVVTLAEPAELRVRWQSRPLRVATGVVGVGFLAAVGYLVMSRAVSAVGTYAVLEQRSAGDVLQVAPQRIGDSLDQMVGVLGWVGSGAMYLPRWAFRAWVGAILLLVGGAVALGRTRARVGVIVVTAGALAFPVVSQLLSRGTGWQGRYGLPLAVGIPIVAGWVVDRSGKVPARAATAVTIALVSLTVVVQVVVHQRYMTRVVLGLPNGLFDSLSRARWRGPATPATLLLGCVLSWVSFAVLLLYPSRDRAAEVQVDAGPG
jgi:hypothetical protein